MGRGAQRARVVTTESRRYTPPTFISALDQAPSPAVHRPETVWGLSHGSAENGEDGTQHDTPDPDITEQPVLGSK